MTPNSAAGSEPVQVTVVPASQGDSPTIVFTLANNSSAPLSVNKISCFYDGEINNNLFDIYPDEPGFPSEQQLTYLGMRLNVANEQGDNGQGANEITIAPGEMMERTIKLGEDYDFSSWIERGCKRFRLSYRAFFSVPGVGLKRLRSNTLQLSL